MLTTRGKQVKEIVLNNLALYAHQKIQQAERNLASLYNEHPVERGRSNLNVGSSAEIVARYEEAINEILRWKKYKEVVEEQKK
jgi:hypothetical protein